MGTLGLWEPSCFDHLIFKDLRQISVPIKISLGPANDLAPVGLNHTGDSGTWLFLFQKHTSRSVLRHQLNDVIPEYRTYLENQDLAPSWIDTLVGTARHIVRWLSFNGIEIEALDIRKIAGFMSHDCTCPSGFQSHVRRRRSRADRFFTYLMDAQLVEMPTFIVQGGEHVDAFISSLSGQGYSGLHDARISALVSPFHRLAVIRRAYSTPIGFLTH